MTTDVSFLKGYDKNFLLFAIDHYVEHVHPITSAGNSASSKFVELSLIANLRKKIDSSNYIFSTDELLKFNRIADLVSTEIITERVDAYQEPELIDEAHSFFYQLSKQLEKVI